MSGKEANLQAFRLFGIAGLICCALSALGRARAGQLKSGRLILLILGLVFWAIGLVCGLTVL